MIAAERKLWIKKDKSARQYGKNFYFICVFFIILLT